LVRGFSGAFARGVSAREGGLDINTAAIQTVVKFIHSRIKPIPAEVKGKAEDLPGSGSARVEQERPED
jgi:hypothetical protein